MAATGVKFGVDKAVSDVAAGGGRFDRVGLITNDAAKTAGDGRASRQALRDGGWNIVRLFGPEHGLAATAADGAKVGDGVDPITSLPVVSLYGERVRPTRESLADLDALVFDIPDCGARFYTYIWTLSHAVEAAADAKIPLVVLDRPNPIGGRIADAEGPMLDEDFASTFVGRWRMPIRHSLTVGELARFWNHQKKIGADVRVVPCTGWTRDMHWPDTKLPFVPMSPAMRTYETALLYPGTCLFEGTNLSEGRGTDWPLRVTGAPWLSDVDGVVEDFNTAKIPGLRAARFDFTPTSRKFEDEKCKGVRLDITDAHAARPVTGGLTLIASIARRHREDFKWLAYKTAVNKAGEGHFDRLIGEKGVRAKVEDGTFDALKLTSCETWPDDVAPILLYK